MKLDAKDKKILECLHESGRAKVSELSKKTKIQRDSIKYRLQRLVSRNILRGLLPRVNYTILGFPLLYRIDVNIASSDLEKETQLLGFLEFFPRVVYVEKITGKWDLSIVIAAKTNHDFDDVLKEIRSKYGDIIKDYEISTISRIVKWWDYRGLL
ncbi:Lrp/AsnC family transcriptional regulator [Candidatus Woesearchaeota archaeon]|nr:Lrp/AsnC family transcriptional regulator [Candidatus Woesearchaeota archaeon]